MKNLQKYRESLEERIKRMKEQNERQKENPFFKSGKFDNSLVKELETEIEGLQYFVSLARKLEQVDNSGLLPKKLLYPDSIATTKLGWSKRGFNEAIEQSRLLLLENLSEEKIRILLLQNIGWFMTEWQTRKPEVDRSDLVRKLAKTIAEELIPVNKLEKKFKAGKRKD